jgi:hypothetical protein
VSCSCEEQKLQRSPNVTGRTIRPSGWALLPSVMPWIGAVLGCRAERAIPRASKVSTYMMLIALPPFMRTSERRFGSTISPDDKGAGPRIQNPARMIVSVERDWDLQP